MQYIYWNHKINTWIYCLAICFQFLIYPSTTVAFPDGWEEMEIEAKWGVTEAVFHDVLDSIQHGGQKYGYNLNVRWGGKPRRYEDHYYDGSSSKLFDDLHVLRYRGRYKTQDYITISDSFSTLTGAYWQLNWEKVQYKSTPTRWFAVWFRNEQGDAKLLPPEKDSALSGSSPHPPYSVNDDPIALLLSDHAGFDFTDLNIALEVVQFRYRIEFLDPVSNVPLYELSLDKIITTVPGELPVNSYGVELEVLINGGHTRGAVNELFILMQNMEKEFNLRRSTASKGRINVADTAFDYIYNPDTGHWYSMNPIALPWHHAKDAADAAGGYIVAINSGEENKWVSEVFGIKHNGDYYWLGGNDIETEGIWEWANGESWSFTNWFYVEPNNAGGIEHALTWLAQGYGNADGYVWNDRDPLQLRASLVEFNYYPMGDLNDDRCVDSADVSIILTEMRSPVPHNLTYDLNKDGTVNIADARYLVRHFSKPKGMPCG